MKVDELPGVSMEWCWKTTLQEPNSDEVEQLDGFFAVLIAGPETVMPSEYYPEVFGGEMSDACEFGSVEEANDILGLMMRHWNIIAETLFKGEVYVPLLLEDGHNLRQRLGSRLTAKTAERYWGQDRIADSLADFEDNYCLSPTGRVV